MASILQLAGDRHPNPRKKFITDLINAIKTWQTSGADIILGGDFNERLGDTQDGLAHLVSSCNLADVHASKHGIHDEPNTYSRGSKRLDYLLMTPRLLDFVDLSGIDPFHQVIHGDHRGLFADPFFPQNSEVYQAILSNPTNTSLQSINT
jgi:hypothetical protein